MVQLHHQIDKIRAAGAELVVVGNGAPHFIKGFRDVTKYDGVLYTDPSLKAYEAAHLERSLWRTLNPRSVVPALRTLGKGFRQGATEGDAEQQGGVFVILPPDRVAYAHVSQRAGDNAPPAEVVAALERAVAAR